MTALADYADFNIDQARSVIATSAEDAKKSERLAAFIAAHETEVFRRMLPTYKPTWRDLTRRLSAMPRLASGPIARWNSGQMSKKISSRQSIRSSRPDHPLRTRVQRPSVANDALIREHADAGAGR
jgi:hypothetical protein